MRQNTLVKDKSKNDICLTIFMAMVWSNSILLPLVRAVLMQIPYIWPHVDMVIDVAYMVILLLALRSFVREIYVKEILYLLLFYAVFYIHYYVFPLNEYYFFLYSNKTLKEVFPMFIIGICAYRINREDTLKVLNFISLITVFAFVVYTALYKINDSHTLSAGDMHAAYNLLPHICVTFASVIRKAKPWNIAAFVVGTLMLLFLGNRGSLLCLGLFVVFSILFSDQVKRPVLFLIVSVAVLLILFSFGLLDYLYRFAEENGFSLRIFKKLESGDITYSSGRDKIKERVIEYILLYPMLGMGIYSDRRVAGGVYAHSLIYEILLSYGIAVGMFILAFLVYLFVKTFIYLRSKGDHLAKDFYSALIFSAVIKLFMSGSYIVEPYFFFVVGFAMSALEERKAQRSKQKREGPVALPGGTYEQQQETEKVENLCDCDQFSMVRSPCSEAD